MIENFFKLNAFKVRKKDKILFEKKVFELNSFHEQKSNFYKNISFFKKNSKKKKIQDLPFLSARVFKQITLHSINKSQIFKTLLSSGTSGDKSKIILDKKNAFNQTRVLIKIFNDFFEKKNRLPMIIVDKPKTKNKNIFLASEVASTGFSFLGKDYFYLLNEKNEIRFEDLKNYIKKYKNSEILIFGMTAFIWQHLIIQNKQNFNLSNAIILHGGGWKKIYDQNANKLNFKKLLKKKYNINRVHDYYGMVEQTGSIFFECERGFFHTSIFSDVLVRDKDFKICNNRKKGIIQVISVLPSSYPGHSILTEDLGIIYGLNNCKCGRSGKFFKINGRLARAEARGCGN